MEKGTRPRKIRKMEASSSAAVNEEQEKVTAHLKLIEGDQRAYQDVIKLCSKQVSIGRCPDSDITWGSLEISRNHVELDYAQGKWRIRDLSRNGVFVFEKQLPKYTFAMLKGGEVISFSPLTKIRYRFAYGEPPKVTPTPDSPIPGPSTGSVAPMPGESEVIPAQRILEFMEEEMACAVCQEILIDPTTIIDCGHIFCNLCMEQLARHRHIIYCPVCRQKCTKRIKQVQLRNLASKLFGLLPAKARMDRQKILDDRKEEVKQQPSSSGGYRGMSVNMMFVAAATVARGLGAVVNPGRRAQLSLSSDEDEVVDVVSLE